MLVSQTGSYSNATHNFKVVKSTLNSAQNLQVTRAEFSIFDEQF